MTADDFREIALSQQGAIERAHMGHPDFRTNGKIFATLEANDESGVVRLSPEEQREFIRLYPKMFTPASGAWGRQGWTVIQLDVADKAAVRGAMMLAGQNVAEKPPRRRAQKPAAARKARSPGKRRK